MVDCISGRFRELDFMRKNKVEYQDITVSGTISLEKINGRRVDIEMSIRPGDTEDLYQKFAIRFAQNEQYQTALSFRPKRVYSED